MSIADTTFAAPVGADVSSVCSKCGDVLHVVLTLKDDLVDRCECKECHRKHKYKPGDAEVIAALKEFKKARRAAARAAAPKKATKKRATRTKVPAIPEVEIDESLPMRKYSTGSSFEVDDQIDHKSFGKGIVIAILPPNKMQVNFVGLGQKTLLFGRDSV